MRSATIIGVAILAAVLAVPSAATTDERGTVRASLITVEGTVKSVTALPGEGELPVVSVSLTLDGDAADEVTVLLAPEQALTEIGFSVGRGDRCRIRIFRPDEGPAKAHKVLNLSRGTMVRLRTLHQIPLWDGRGRWQGGPCRNQSGSGAGGHRHRGGR
jgi:hypothetical protein